MHDNRPEPLLVLLAVDLAGVDDVDDPEYEVHHQQEAHHLPAWLPPELARGVDGPVAGVRNEERLQEGLQDDDEVGTKGQERLHPLKHEVSEDCQVSDEKYCWKLEGYLVVTEQSRAGGEQEDATRA